MVYPVTPIYISPRMIDVVCQTWNIPVDCIKMFVDDWYSEEYCTDEGTNMFKTGSKRELKAFNKAYFSENRDYTQRLYFFASSVARYETRVAWYMSLPKHIAEFFPLDDAAKESIRRRTDRDYVSILN